MSTISLISSIYKVFYLIYETVAYYSNSLRVFIDLDIKSASISSLTSSIILSDYYFYLEISTISLSN